MSTITACLPSYLLLYCIDSIHGAFANMCVETHLQCLRRVTSKAAGPAAGDDLASGTVASAQSVKLVPPPPIRPERSAKVRVYVFRFVSRLLSSPSLLEVPLINFSFLSRLFIYILLGCSRHAY